MLTGCVSHDRIRRSGRIRPQLYSEPSHSLGVAGALPFPSPSTCSFDGTTRDTTALQFRRLPRRELLPPVIPFHVMRDESPIHREHHRAVDVPELPRHQLHRDACPKAFGGPVVASIVEPEDRKPQRPLALPVMVLHKQRSRDRNTRSPGVSVSSHCTIWGHAHSAT